MDSIKTNTCQFSEKEKIIIEAARKRFAHFGYSKVSMEEIAVDVDLGKASLYYYFPTKENLYQAVLSKEQNGFIKEIEGLIASKISAGEKLVEFVNMRIIYFKRFLNLGTLSLHAFMDSKSFYTKLFLNFEDQELILIDRIISEGQSNGEFEKKLDSKTATVLLHVLHGLRIRVSRGIKELEVSDEAIRQLQTEMNIAIRIFIKGISK
ncbi:MAG: TetR/AcrR family transcriptional regulator [Bacteroidota bacterium]|nr:TetR/AcrR family transcriptional regulator [Bacteroidota bacterium]